MLLGKSIGVVMPAYNAERTLERTYNEIPHDIVDDVILVDDNSSDGTIRAAERLNLRNIIKHDWNLGYGGNQKTCYRRALEIGSDVVVMLHPDYQYTPKLIRSMVALLCEGVYDVVLGSRILGTGALQGGMPRYKYVANRFLTAFENVMIGQKLSEYHTGYRAFTRELLECIPLHENSDDFVFDNQMLAQVLWFGYTIAEVSCPTKYFKEASSINFRRSVKYGFGCLSVGMQFRLAKWGWKHSSLFPVPGKPKA